MRGFMLDSARTLECRRYYRRFIDFVAERGVDTLLWHFTDDQGCSLRFDCLPEAASPNAYSKAEMRELLAYARQRGVMVIPELETLGHTRYITRTTPALADLAESDEVFTSLCPVAPSTREIIGALLDEVAELFDAPWVHVGLDEVNFGDHPLTREALKTRSAGALFADHILFVHERLAAHGKRAMMWGDHLLKDPTIAEALPRDIVVANWQYMPRVPRETTQRLLGWGFEVVLCPALISYDQMVYAGQSFALPNLRDTAQQAEAEPRVMGTITTIWTPQRYLHDSLWAALHLAAAIMRDGAGVEVRGALSQFAESFHGFTPSSPWLDAMQTLFERIPMRKPWIAALRLEMSEDLQAVDIAGEAGAWASVLDALRRERAVVHREEQSYDTLMLMVEVLAHAWERLGRFGEGQLQPSVLACSEALGARLSEAWDRERFADDPRKRQPVFPFDEINHLLPVFEQGTEVVRHHLATSRTDTVGRSFVEADRDAGGRNRRLAR